MANRLLGFSNAPVSRFEIASYLLLTAGVFGDHLSTGIALTKSNIRETNPIALGLMQGGLWLYADLILISGIVLLTYFMTRAVKNPAIRYMLLCPMMVGVIRLAVTFWNLSLLFV